MKMEYVCAECGLLFESSENRKFCSLSCSSKYNNQRRNLSKETKEKISRSIGEYHKNNAIDHQYKCEKCGDNFSQTKRIRGNRKIHCQKCKRIVIQFRNTQDVNSLLDLSGRTVKKILERLAIGCSNCGWAETTGDIHHINGKKTENPDSHDNLAYLCPNCHRLAHNKKLEKCKIIKLSDYIGNKWKEYYNV
jgi:DNA-directed RNA polymerase subunit RPC12/RpoP